MSNSFVKLGVGQLSEFGFVRWLDFSDYFHG